MQREDMQTPCKKSPEWDLYPRSTVPTTVPSYFPRLLCFKKKSHQNLVHGPSFNIAHFKVVEG